MHRRSLAFLLALAACASDRGGPTPVPTGVSPNLICTAQFPNTVTIAGSGFSPAVIGALTDQPTVEMPGIVFASGATTYTADPANVALPNGDRTGTMLAVTIPMGALGPQTSDQAAVVYDLQVTNPNDNLGSLANALTVVPPPSLSAIAPNSGAVDTQVSFTLTGNGFRDGMTVTLDVPGAAVTATGVTVQSSTTATGTFDLTGVAPGTYDVTVTNAEGCTFTLPQAFTVYVPKIIRISGIDPPFGCTCSPTTVTISSPAPGDFRSTPIVEITPTGTTGTVPVLMEHVAFVDETTLTAVVPEGLALGDYDVTVVNPRYDGGIGKLTAGFRVVADPVPIVTSLEPPAATTQDSPTVKVLGANFRSTVKIELIGAASPTPVLTRSGLTPASDGEVDFTIAANSLPAAPYLVRVWDEDEQTYFTFSAFLMTNPAGKLNIFHDEVKQLNTGRFLLAGASADDDLGNHYVYAIGGQDGGGVLDDVEVTQLARFGVLGDWKPIPRNHLTAPRSGARAVTVRTTGGKSYVYVIGGRTTGTQVFDSVERAVVLSTADAPAFSDATANPGAGGLDAGTWYYKVAAVLGAGDPDNPSGETLSSDEAIVTLGSGGSITITWDAVAGAESYRVYRTDAVNGRSQQEHLISTTSNTTFTDDGLPAGTERFLPDGSLGTWGVVSAAALGTPRWGHQALLVHDDGGAPAVVVLGGKNALMGGVLASIERAAVNADTGALGAFTTGGTTSLAPARAFFHAALATPATSKLTGAPGRIWVSAGVDDNGGVLDSVMYSDIQNGGGNGAWHAISPQRTSRVVGLMSVVSNNTLFMLGGAAGISDGAGGPTFSRVGNTGRQMTFDDSGGGTNLSISSTSNTLLGPRAFGVVVQGAGFFYFIGGTSNGTNTLTSTESTF